MRLQPVGSKRQAGGTPTGAVDTWCLVARPGCWAGRAPGSSHLTLGLPSLRRGVRPARVIATPIGLGPAA